MKGRGGKISWNIAGQDVFISSKDRQPRLTGEVVTVPFVLQAKTQGKTLTSGLPTDSSYKKNMKRVSASRWWDLPNTSSPLEAEVNVVKKKPSNKRTAVFFTGGVDSFYILKSNLDNVDLLVNVQGFDIPLTDASRLRKMEKLLKKVGKALGKETVTVTTNLRSHHLFKSLEWGKHTHVSALAMVAHSLKHHASTFLIAGSSGLTRPWGSHPSMDGLWGGGDLVIKTDSFPRIGKVHKLISWDIAKNNLKVCWENKKNAWNCGRCEKCLRTEMEFLVYGVRPPTFPSTPVEARLMNNKFEIRKGGILAEWKNVYKKGGWDIKSLLRNWCAKHGKGEVLW